MSTQPATPMTEATAKLFDELAADAGNWSGTPEVWITRAQRGNLTDLKARGLLTTFPYNGGTWAAFTTAGLKLARERGHNMLDDWADDGGKYAEYLGGQ